MVVKTKEEILEQQRAEATKKYADDVNKLIKQAMELEIKCKNLNQTINDAVSQRQSELTSLIEELKVKIIDAENRKTDAQLLFKEAEAKNLMANKIAEDILAKKRAHEESVNMHVDSAQQERDFLSTRHAIFLEKELSADIKNKESDNRMTEVLRKEEEISSLISALNTLRSNTDVKIQAQLELEKNNKYIIEEIVKQRNDVMISINNLRQERENLNRSCAEHETSRTSLNYRKIDLDKKEKDLKEIEIKNKVESQRLLDRQKDIDYREGKLNELKNNVDALMKMQEQNKGV